MKFWAIRPHGAGFFQAEEVSITGDTREEVLRNAQSGMIGSRYLSSIYTEDGRTILWAESKGWTDEGKKLLPN